MINAICDDICWTYEAFDVSLGVENPLPSFITHTNKLFTVQSNDLADIKTYSIKLVATLPN